ncbi:uncharacterized protein G2W53_024542 [Senna tora]|uniref:Uncharacterized protein n=1 Tax=Senna tora TaxID=362788 RepID=A0A834TBR2_9FABA|nr:uncharacterized protein G2W53_024542 [Senna tora]
MRSRGVENGKRRMRDKAHMRVGKVRSAHDKSEIQPMRIGALFLPI